MNRLLVILLVVFTFVILINGDLQVCLTYHMCIVAWVASACKKGTTRLLWRIRSLSL